jgi:putative ABC transport system permease protein
MNLLLIAWRSIQQRWLASLLTGISMALGVVLVVMVLSIHGVISESFRSNASLGYNMIVGAKGGKLQLTLNTVYYLSQPVENIPYDYYLEFHKADRRRQEFAQSFAGQARRAEAQAAELQALSACAGLDASSPLTAALAAAALERSDAARIEPERDGKFALYTDMAIPLCLGDYYGRFRVVGTVPELFERIKFGPEGDRSFVFAQGRNFRHHDPQHGYFEAVVGATVARELGIEEGREISPAHGAPEGHTHENKFTVVGVLAPTGTPNDRAVFVNIEGFYLMEDHAKPLPKDESEGPREPPPPEEPPSDEGAPPAATPPNASPDAVSDAPHGDAEAPAAAGDHAHVHLDPLPIEQREVTAVLVRTTRAIVTPYVENNINEGSVAQAVLPVREIYNLFSFIVEPIQLVLLGLTAMICVVSGISILVSIYNSMSERRHEIAVMRALGAGRGTVMTIILLEAVLLSLLGGGAGWIGAHVLNAVFSGHIENETGVSIGLLSFVLAELFIVPGLLLLSVVVGILPALSAYRTDVARSLGK